MSYLRTKTSYDSHRETSEHPLIYDDANIHFYRSNHASSSSNTYLMDRRPIVRDLSGLSQQVRTLVLTYLSPNRMLASKSNSFFLAFFVGPSKLAFDASMSKSLFDPTIFGEKHFKLEILLPVLLKSSSTQFRLIEHASIKSLIILVRKIVSSDGTLSFVILTPFWTDDEGARREKTSIREAAVM